MMEVKCECAKSVYNYIYVHACDASNEDFANFSFGNLEDFRVILLRNGDQCN